MSAHTSQLQTRSATSSRLTSAAFSFGGEGRRGRCSHPAGVVASSPEAGPRSAPRLCQWRAVAQQFAPTDNEPSFRDGVHEAHPYVGTSEGAEHEGGRGGGETAVAGRTNKHKHQKDPERGRVVLCGHAIMTFFLAIQLRPLCVSSNAHSVPWCCSQASGDRTKHEEQVSLQQAVEAPKSKTTEHILRIHTVDPLTSRENNNLPVNISYPYNVTQRYVMQDRMLAPTGGTFDRTQLM